MLGALALRNEYSAVHAPDDGHEDGFDSAGAVGSNQRRERGSRLRFNANCRTTWIIITVLCPSKLCLFCRK